MTQARGTRPRWILAIAAGLALVAVITLWTSREHRSTDGAASSSGPTGNPKGDPQAQCTVLALAALEMLAQEDDSVVAQLEAAHDPSTRFIADVVHRNQAAFLAEARRSSRTVARQRLAPTIRADCLRAPA